MQATASNPTQPIHSSDAALIAQKSNEARIALQKALRDAARHTAQGVDPALWMKRFPLASLGTALLGGFALGVTTIPGKRPGRNPLVRAVAAAANFTRDVKAEMSPPSKPAAPPADGHAKPEPGSAPTGTWRSILFHELMELFRPMVLRILTSRVSAAMDAHDGHAPAANQTSADAPGAAPVK
jgi:hypothetical protein